MGVNHPLPTSESTMEHQLTLAGAFRAVLMHRFEARLLLEPALEPFSNKPGYFTTDHQRDLALYSWMASSGGHQLPDESWVALPPGRGPVGITQSFISSAEPGTSPVDVGQLPEDRPLDLDVLAHRGLRAALLELGERHAELLGQEVDAALTAHVDALLADQDGFLVANHHASEAFVLPSVVLEECTQAIGTSGARLLRVPLALAESLSLRGFAGARAYHDSDPTRTLDTFECLSEGASLVDRNEHLARASALED